MDGKAQPVDLRDVIAERMTALSRPVNALGHLVQRHEDLPGRDAAQAFIIAWEDTIAAFANFLQADADAADQRTRDELAAVQVDQRPAH